VFLGLLRRYNTSNDRNPGMQLALGSNQSPVTGGHTQTRPDKHTGKKQDARLSRRPLYPHTQFLYNFAQMHACTWMRSTILGGVTWDQDTTSALAISFRSIYNCSYSYFGFRRGCSVFSRCISITRSIPRIFSEAILLITYQLSLRATPATRNLRVVRNNEDLE
jgi:hypothetical protein